MATHAKGLAAVRTLEEQGRNVHGTYDATWPPEVLRNLKNYSKQREKIGNFF